MRGLIDMKIKASINYINANKDQFKDILLDSGWRIYYTTRGRFANKWSCDTGSTLEEITVSFNKIAIDEIIYIDFVGE
jgi:hypothetical protein